MLLYRLHHYTDYFNIKRRCHVKHLGSWFALEMYIIKKGVKN